VKHGKWGDALTNKLVRRAKDRVRAMVVFEDGQFGLRQFVPIHKVEWSDFRKLALRLEGRVDRDRL
jgi:hypothetical protein